MLHHPPHLYMDETWYMVTAGSTRRPGVLEGDPAKALVRDTLRALVQQFAVTLLAWVILDNHYHLLLKLHRGKDLSLFVGRLHGSTSYRLNQIVGSEGRRTWHNYWDTCVRNEADLWTRFNYIHQTR